MTTRRIGSWAFTLIAGAVFAWGLISGPVGQVDPYTVGDKIACPKCEGESAAASQTPTARAMMEVVNERIAEGMSEREILDWFAARYGPDIILEPPLDLGGIALWVVPVLVVVAGSGLAWHATRTRTRTRTEEDTASGGNLLLVGAAALILTGLAFGIGQFVQPRAPGSAVSGDLEIEGGQDLDGVSNEEMEAVLQQFAEIPEANRMRLALARRYFEEGNYSKAVEHFRTVLDNDPTAAEASEALGRLGWILFANGETAAAEAAYLQALDALPSNGEAKWFYAIQLVESGRGDEAVPLLEDLLAAPDVPAEVATEVERLLNEAKGQS